MHFNGHKEWLEDYLEANPKKKTVQVVVARAALYLGEVLTATAWAAGYTAAASHRPPQWWFDEHGQPPGMEQ